MKILVGLGNPGEKYERNRHNVGFMALDAIAQHYDAPQWRKRFQGQATEVDIGRQRYLLLKPLTYMNESGRSVSEAVRFYKMAPADVIVFHDEIDLEPGKLRVKFGGGHAGHNGLKSVSAHIGNDYQRVRIGVGHPGSREAVVGYVLHDFSRGDREWLDGLLSGIARSVPALVTGQDAKFLNEVARVARPQPAGKPAAAQREKQPEPAMAQASPDAAARKPEPVAASPAPEAPRKPERPVRRGQQEPAETSLGAKLVAWLRRS